MPTVSDVNVTNILKVLQKDKELQYGWLENQPLLDWMPKSTDFYGESIRVPVGYGPGGGRGHQFGKAREQSNNGAKFERFEITRARDYGVLYIENEAIEASEKGEGAWVPQFQMQLKGLNASLGQSLGWKLLEDGEGLMAQVTGAPVGNVITLDSNHKIMRFEVGQRLDVYIDGAAPKAKRGGPVGYLTVDKVNERDGTIEVTDITHVTSVSNTDWLVPYGDYQLAPVGIRGYIPFEDSELTATPTLWGLDRSKYPERLGGRRYDASAMSLTGGIETALNFGGRAGVKYDALWVGNEYWSAFSEEAGNRLTREESGKANFGYSGFTFTYAKGVVPVHIDHNLDQYALALTRKDWDFKFLKKPMRYLTMGATSIIHPTADGIEVRYGWRGQPICNRPNGQMAIKLPALSLW